MGSSMRLKLFIIFFLIAMTGVFIVQNTEVVDLRFLLWKITMSRALMFVFLMLIGIATGWLLRGHLLHKAWKKSAEDI